MVIPHPHPNADPPQPEPLKEEPEFRSIMGELTPFLEGLRKLSALLPVDRQAIP